MLHMENERTKKRAIVVVVVFCCLILVLSTALTVYNAVAQQKILEDTIKSQLLSITYAAREMIDEYPFDEYNSVEDIENDPGYIELRQRLRDLAGATGAEYIYALKWLGGDYQFVLDSDPADEEVFIPYDVSDVHLEAFGGKEVAGVNNVVDEYGSFHSAALPLFKNGRIIGIVSTDIEDDHLNQSVAAARRGSVLMIVMLLGTMALMLGFLSSLLRRLRKLQAQLEKMAHYDNVTGLPNRQYLLDYLASITGEGKDEPFALMFIDLDNFKTVNDNAGHDAGDELLQYVARFLEERHQNVKSFRPSAGLLNVSARIGGDEFIQVIHGVDSVEKADEIARQLVEDFSKNNYNRYIEKFKVGMSVGVALYPYHSDKYHVLIKYADIAMYHAKHAGKNSWRIYSDDMEPKAEK